MSQWTGLRVLFLEDEQTPLLQAAKNAVEKAHVPAELVVGVLVSEGGRSSEQLQKKASAQLANLDKAKWFVEQPGEVYEVAQRVGEICRRERCHVAVLDLQLRNMRSDDKELEDDRHKNRGELGTKARPLQEGVLIGRELNRRYGIHHLVWRTRHAADIKNNATGQVRFGRNGGRLTFLECPRAFVVDPSDQDELGSALLAIYDDVFARLRSEQVEWEVPAYRIGQLRRMLLGQTGSTKHTFQNATPADIDRWGDFELIPRYDPPCPLGLWLLSYKNGVQYLEEARGATAAKLKDLGQGLEDWLDKHLWGLAFAGINDFLERTLAIFGLPKSEVVLPSTTGNSPAMIVPCARSSLVTAVGNALKNACENKKNGTKLKLAAEFIKDDSKPYVLLVVANEVASNVIAMTKMATPRGLRYIEESIEELNGLAPSVNKGGWGFQFGVWTNGLCVSNLICKPWRCGINLPNEVAGGTSQILKTITSNGDWATASFVCPVKFKSQGGGENEGDSC